MRASREPCFVCVCVCVSAEPKKCARFPTLDDFFFSARRDPAVLLCARDSYYRADETRIAEIGKRNNGNAKQSMQFCVVCFASDFEQHSQSIQYSEYRTRQASLLLLLPKHVLCACLIFLRRLRFACLGR